MAPDPTEETTKYEPESGATEEPARVEQSLYENWGRNELIEAASEQGIPVDEDTPREEIERALRESEPDAGRGGR